MAEFNEIIQGVSDQVRSLGDTVSGMKKNYDTMRNEYEDLKKLVGSNTDDVVVKERMEKFSLAIALRQDEMDKKTAEMQKGINDRIDQIEVAFNRPRQGQAENKSADYEQAKQFLTTVAAVNSNDEKGLTYEKARQIEVNVDEYKKYCSAFEGYIRKHGGSREALLAPEEIKTLLAGVDPDGGYTVPTQMSNMIITKLFESDPMRQLANVETISTNAIEWLVDADEAGATWEAETVASSNYTTPQFNKKRIAVHMMGTRPRASQVLLEDSGLNIESWLSNKVADKFLRTEQAAFIDGDGIGKPRGILSYADGSTWGTIEQVHMGHASALTADGFIKIKYALIEQYLQRGTWLMNRGTVSKAIQLKDGTGNYLWQPGLAAGQPSMILGLPVRMSTTMPAVSTSTLSVALADWKEAYMIVDRIGITVQRDPYTAKPLVEFYFRKRVGGDVANFTAIKIGTIEA